MARTALKGSEKTPLPGSRVVGPADPTQRVQVSMLLRRRGQREFQERVRRLTAGDASVGILGREQFAHHFGADPADIAAVKAFASQYGLSVIKESAARRTVLVAGTVAQVEPAFGVRLQRFDHPDGAYRGRQGVIELPSEIHGLVEDRKSVV